MVTSNSVPEIKRIFEENIDNTLRITLKCGDVFVLELDGEVDEETYGENGIWLCWIVEAVDGKNPQFHKLFKAGNGLDIYENDICEIVDTKSGRILYSNCA